MKSTVALCFLAVLATGHCMDLSNNIIDVLVVFDTVSLIDDFNGKSRSKDPDHPTPINHTYAFMITAKKNVVSGQATGVLHIKCKPGDVINWYGVSKRNNFGHQIILYDIKHDSALLSDVSMETKKRHNVFPVKDNIKKIKNFEVGTVILNVSVKDSGIVKYSVNCAIYVLSRGTGKRTLFGYFTWDAMITINSP